MLNVNGKSKVICVIVSVLALFVFLSFTSSASNENKDEFSFSNMTEIFDKLTSETLDENEISDFKISNLKDVSFKQMLSFAVDKIKDEIGAERHRISAEYNIVEITGYGLEQPALPFSRETACQNPCQRKNDRDNNFPI